MQDIKDYLSYDPDTGVFIWIKKPSIAVAIGRIAGAVNNRGYTCIQYKGKTYKAYRLAWWYVYGEMPEFDIDHINEIKTDNRIGNLRIVTHAHNMQNVSKPRLDNKSGFKGVTWHNNKWRSAIKLKGKQIHLGYYNTPEEAHAAYVCAKREHHPFWVEKVEVV